MKVGSASTRLVVVRGNSASGKSTIAAEIRSRYGRGIAIVSQDYLRRTVLKEDGPALAARRIDAAWLVEPFLTEVEARDGVQAVADRDQGATQNFPISGYAATTAWTRKYSKTAAAFIRALSRGQQLADTSRPAVEQVLVMRRYIGVTRQVAALVVTGDFPTGVNRVQIQRVADIMHQFGMLKNRFNVAPMIS